MIRLGNLLFSGCKMELRRRIITAPLLSKAVLCLQGFSDHFAEQVEHYRRYFDDADAHRYPLHGEWDEKLSLLEKLIVCRCVRADKVCLAAVVAEVSIDKESLACFLGDPLGEHPRGGPATAA